MPRDRPEPFIFIVTGRIVACLASMAAQRRGDWGAIIVDDGSAPWTREHLALAVGPWRDRITLLQPRERRGQMTNMTLAIRHICTNPDSVIVTLDLDDVLIGTGVLDRVAVEYERGADVTVGSMLRTDKHAEYPATLEHPRLARGGNVWQQLRTFHKRLFDAIPDQDLRLHGRYVDMAVDWAFMLPIVEMARHPVWIRNPLYLYEPSGLGKGPDRAARERQIAGIVAKPARRPPGDSRHLLRPEDMGSAPWLEDGGILFIRHGERPSFKGLDATERDAVQLTEGGRAAAMAMGRALPKPIQVVSSPVLRSVRPPRRSRRPRAWRRAPSVS